MRSVHGNGGSEEEAMSRILFSICVRTFIVIVGVSTTGTSTPPLDYGCVDVRDIDTTTALRVCRHPGHRHRHLTAGVSTSETSTPPLDCGCVDVRDIDTVGIKRGE